ncbi:MAG TPA: type I secretion system permease/ATPase, partial [Ramlibacter sp.]|nr:type I secretion system permease/ATPase [Ramlibacter sp.]
DRNQLTPDLLARAAHHAHLRSRLVRQNLAEAKDALLPAIVLLKHERACVLLGFDAERGKAKLVYPELGDAPTWVPLSELAAEYTGVLAYLRPIQHFDARSPALRGPRQGHWFWQVIAENRPLYRDVLLAALLANMFALGLPLFVMTVYDRVVPNHALDTLWVLAAGLSLMLVGDLVLRLLRGWFIDLAGARSDVKLSAHIMERVLGTRLEHRPVSAGALAASLRGYESIRDFIGSATVTAFIDLPFGIVFLLVIGWIAPPMLVPLLLGGAVLIAYALLVQRRMRDLSETIYRAGAERNAVLVEGLVGLETIKAIGAEAPIQRKWERSAGILARAGTRLRLLASSATHASGFAQQTISMVIVITGVYLIADQALSIGGLIACTMLASRVMAPVGAAAGLLVHYHSAATALTSLNGLMAKEVERPDEARFLARGRLQGGIEFRDVSFTYPGQERPALRNVNLRINPGERVAILGRVGSGKSTLQRLILGLYRPSSGAVLADGIDLRQLDPSELRRQIGYVEQKVTLFYGTLRENITIAAPLAGDEDLVRATRLAGLADLVNTHPHGFDLMIGERGESLSGGQRQAVALARAVANEPPILLLDEPTSAMDHSTELAVRRNLAAYAQGRTLLIVSHRSSMLELADRIIVVDGGQIVADGPRSQVIVALRQGLVAKAA